MTVTIRIGKWARLYTEQGSLQLSLAEGRLVSDALTELDVPADEIGVTVLNGRAVSRSTKLSDGDMLELLPMIIGG
jgi:sulfur carrier protein ThiS